MNARQKSKRKEVSCIQVKCVRPLNRSANTKGKKVEMFPKIDQDRTP